MSTLDRAGLSGTNSSPGRRAWLSIAAIGAVLALGVVLRTVQFTAGASLWFDELALALNIQERGFLELATEPLDRLQVAPVGFLLSIKAVTYAVGSGELALRIVPFLCALAAVFLFWRISTRFVAGPGLLYGLLFFCVSPSLVALAGMTKPYSCDVAVTLLLVWLGMRSCERAPVLGRSLAAGAVGAFGILLSNPAVPTAALIGGLLVARALRERQRVRLGPMAAMLVPWGLAALVGAVLAVQLLDPATETYMKDFWSEGFPPSGLAAVPWLLRQLFGVVAHLLIFIVPSGGPLAALVILPMLIALVGGPSLFKRNSWAAALVLAPLVVAVVCAAFDLMPLRTRVSLSASWPILLCAMAGIERAARSGLRTVRVVALALAVLSAGLPAAAVLFDSPPPYRAESMRPVLEQVQARRQGQDELYVYYGARYAIEFYGPRTGIEAWIQGGEHRGDPRAYLHELDGLRGRARAWFVFTHALPRYGEIELIRRYLEIIGTIVDEVPDPFGLTGERAAGAWLVDLSDPDRLSAVTADSFELRIQPNEGD